MFSALSPVELGRLRMSVGYGRHRKGRPLSPIEVGALLQKARWEGASLKECASALQLAGTGHLGRFLQILTLPDDIQHLVDWGSGKEFLGFTSAVELTKLKDAADQRVVAEAVISDDLSSKEVRQVAQLRSRSGRTIEACLAESVGMRPRVEKRYIFIGSVASVDAEALRGRSQADRDVILASGIETLGLQSVTGRLSPQFFTLVGGEGFEASMQKIGRENIEARLRCHISEAVENVGPSG